MTELDDDILTLFFDSALAATAPVFLTATGLYEGACESGTVTSHTSDLPWAHGIDVSLSGLLPSDLDNPDGSRVDGIPAEAIALYTRHFNSCMLMVLSTIFITGKSMV